jgi:hypothetical protein
VKDTFRSGWITGFARAAFQKVRNPGAPAAKLSPSAAVLATELDGIAEGFADAIEAAKAWTIH